MTTCKHPDCKYRDIKNDLCEYILITGHRRPCPGGECAGVYVPREDGQVVVRKHRARKKRRYRFDTEKAMELYLAGYTDTDIAGVVGVSSGTISSWRKDQILPPQKALKRSLSEE